MRGHWFWDFAFLNSNYHLEHHYFAGVPFYRLPALQRALEPFYARHGMRWQNYSGLLYGWLVGKPRAAHELVARRDQRGSRCCSWLLAHVGRCRSRPARLPARPLTSRRSRSARRSPSPSSISAG